MVTLTSHCKFFYLSACPSINHCNIVVIIPKNVDQLSANESLKSLTCLFLYCPVRETLYF